MTHDYYLHPDDLVVVRNDENWPTKAVCYDGDGAHIYNFPLEMTDDQIREAVCFANRVYKIGRERGAAAKAHQLRAALGLAD